MKILEDVKKILENYNLSVYIPDEYMNVYQYRDAHPIIEEDFSHPEINDSYLFEKYKNNIPVGWYGFSIGEPTPKNWLVVIDKIVKLCVTADPQFEIHQIKMKFGGICFYVESKNIDDIYDVCSLIENTLFNDKLIY
jgi:hypothetical protein